MTIVETGKRALWVRFSKENRGNAPTLQETVPSPSPILAPTGPAVERPRRNAKIAGQRWSSKKGIMLLFGGRAVERPVGNANFLYSRANGRRIKPTDRFCRIEIYTAGLAARVSVKKYP